MFHSELLFRAFSAFGIVMTFTQGVALGYHISRLWRWEPRVFTQSLPRGGTDDLITCRSSFARGSL